MKIKSIPEDERPREKLIRFGAKVLSNSELLAIILRTGRRKENAINLSMRLLKENNLREISILNINSLKRIKGIGTAKACQIVSCFELGRRLSSFKEEKRFVVKDSKKIAEILMPEMQFLEKEHFKVVFLDSRLRIIKEETVFIGSLNSSVIHPREIFKAALRENAAAVVFVHNHPSMDPEPSDEDILVTKELVEAGELLGIKVVDHIIIGGKEFFSFKDKGYL